MANSRADFYISIMDSDLVVGVLRSTIALHSEDDDGKCKACRVASPCETIHVITTFQEQAIDRALPSSSQEGHEFKYPECPLFTGEQCDQHGKPRTKMRPYPPIAGDGWIG